MAIESLIWACRSALENMLPAAQEAADTAATDRTARGAVLASDEFLAVVAGQDDIQAMVDEVRQTLEEDGQQSDTDQQEFERVAEEWFRALDALQQLVSDDQ